MSDDVISHNANINNENIDSVKRDEKSPITENEEQESKTMKPVNKETKKKATIVTIIAILVAVLIGSGVLLWLVMSRPSDTSIPAPKSKAITQDTVRPPLDTIKSNDDVKDSTKIDSNIVDTTNKASTDTPKSILPPTTPPVTPKPKVETKPASPSAPKTNQSATKPQQISTPATAEFAVQVYASPSRSDAEARLATLKDKGLEGVLSTYQKRGEVWYRVRLSQHFKTYEEAKSFATSNGLSKVWIDRIK
jgi:cell division protein FtsN